MEIRAIANGDAEAIWSIWRLNTITDTFPYMGMCQYDARLFDGASLFKVLQVHPFMIAQGQLVRNPFYIKPEEFLAGLGMQA